jgi:hypothetical protein
VTKTPSTDIARNLDSLRARIAAAAARAGRRDSDVTLVAVTKTFAADAVRAALDAGQLDFGENKVQEGLDKVRTVGDPAARWHLIGHLQSNKARKAAAAFQVIHSIDRVELVAALDRGAVDAGRRPDVLIQVDLAGEATKHGVSPDAVRPLVDSLLGAAALRLVGLMLLPPYFEDPEQVRPYFRRLRELRDALAAEYREAAPTELSMGMSHDFEVAIEEGATIVRLGTAVFGERSMANI